MKQLSEYKTWLKNIVENNLENKHLEFVWSIMRSPFVEYHYDLLKDKNLNTEFRGDLAFRFKEHGEEAEDFLISKLDNNQDIDFQADIIFLLGGLNKKYKSKTLDYARKFSESEDDYKRDRAIIVLGWIGRAVDTKIFEKHLLNDNNPNCRAWSASSYMQMWFRNESEVLKTTAFETFKTALTNEPDYFVIATILSTIRVMGKTKLGISQTALDELDTEKIDLAKPKAIRFLEKALKNK